MKTLNIFVIATLALLSMLQLASGDDSVTTHVDADAKVKFFYREEHPSIFLKCWGDRTVTRNDSGKVSGRSDSNSGTIGGATSAEGFNPYTPQTITYSSQLTEDKIFKLSFSQTVSAPRAEEWRSECTIHKYYAQVEGVSNRFQTGARLTVPENVYVLRVRKTSTGASSLGLVDKITNTGSISVGSAEKKDVVMIGGWEYRFVQPGDQIDFSVEYTTARPETVAFSLDYEITFVGQNRCESVLGGIAKFSTSASDVKQVFSLAKSGDEQSVHNFALAMGCLGNPIYREKLFTQSNGKDIGPFLNELNKQSTELGNRDSQFRDATTVIAKMGLYNLAKGFLNDLKPYCEIKTIRSFAGPAKNIPIQVRGFSYAAQQYALTWNLFNQVPIENLNELAKIMDDMKSNQRTFNAVMADANNRNILKAYQTAIFNGDLRIFDLIQRIVLGLPETKVGLEARQRLLTSLKAADAKAWDVQQEVANTLKSFGRRSSEIVDPTVLKKKIENLTQVRSAVAGDLDSMVQWFDEDMATKKPSAFYGDLFSVNYEIMNVIGGALKDNYSAFLTKFIDYEGMRKLYGEVSQCLATANPESVR